MIYKFSDLIGNKVTIQLIKNSINNEAYPNFSILTGVMGTGKSSTSKAIALALTCDDKTRVNLAVPCCNCPNCKSAIQGFNNSGKSSNVMIFNAGEFDDIKQVKDMCDTIFNRDNGLQNKVFIIEEAHALADIKGAQTMLLEHLDRIPKSVYVIMCTTEEYRILKTLKSRAIVFNFKYLNKAESKLLLHNYAKKMASRYGTFPSDAVQDIILKHSNGVPRDLERAMDFAMSAAATEEDLREFYQQISDKVFIDLFTCLKQKDLSSFLFEVTEMLRNWTPDIIQRSLSDFVVRAYFVSIMHSNATIDKNGRVREHADTKKTFSEEDFELIKDVLPPKAWNVCVLQISSWEKETTEEGMQIKFVKLFNKLVFGSEAAGLLNSADVLANERIKGSTAFQENEELNNEISST